MSTEQTETPTETPVETPTEAPAAEAPVETPAAETPPPDDVSRETEVSDNARTAVEMAFDAVDAEYAAREGQPRNPDGTFAKKEEATPETPETPPVATETPAPETPLTPEQIAQKAAEEAAKAQETPKPEDGTAKFAEPPSRFSQDAKTVWKDVPDAAKAEIHRAVTEMEQGIAQHKLAFEPYRALDERLKANNQTINEVVAHYSGIEDLLRQNPIAGLEKVCNNLGLSLRQVANHVVGNQPDAEADDKDRLVIDLRNEISALKNEINGVKTNVTNQAEAQRQTLEADLVREMEAFKKTAPRFDELTPEMTALVNAGLAKGFEDAYAMAERLKPAPVTTPEVQPAVPVDQIKPATPAVQQPTQAAQTPKGQLSTIGAPSTGSNPDNKETPSTRDALKNRFAEMGISD